ncbi:MAG: hypothetical protein PHE77_01265 [Candidatus Pacebacteria bacterium]|nr:hypothetical protein [Candidatus Paceibacterota bacterium]
MKKVKKIQVERLEVSWGKNNNLKISRNENGEIFGIKCKVVEGHFTQKGILTLAQALAVLKRIPKDAQISVDVRGICNKTFLFDLIQNFDFGGNQEEESGYRYCCSQCGAEMDEDGWVGICRKCSYERESE